jgi:uncharacterized membrane protein
MRKYFLYGLAILLPCVLTYLITLFFLNLVTAPFMPLAKAVIARVFPAWFSGEGFLIAAKLLVLICLFIVIVMVGLLGQLFLVKKLIEWADTLLHKLPIISKIYRPLQDLMRTIFTEKKASKFSQVVLVPFPTENELAIGMVTRHEMPDRSKTTDKLYSVFVPGTPNPSVGFMLSFKEEQLIFLEMDVKSALAFVVSCGVVLENKSVEKTKI